MPCLLLDFCLEMGHDRVGNFPLPGVLTLPETECRSMRVKTFIALVLMLLFSYLAIRRVEWSLFIQAFGEMDLLGWLLAVPIYLLQYFFRALRWRTLLKPVRRVPVRTLYAYSVVGMALNDLVPARLGEFYRAYLLFRRERLAYPTALAGIFTERVLDGLTIVGALALVLAFLPVEAQWVHSAEYAASAVFGLIFSALLLLRYKPAFSHRLLDILCLPLPAGAVKWIRKIFDDTMSGIAWLGRPGALSGAALASIAVWMTTMVFYYLVFRSFGMPATFGWAALTVCMVSLAVALPTTPGYIGVFHLALVMSLGLFGVDQSRALAVAVVLNITELAATGALGAFFIYRLGLPLPGRKDFKSLVSEESP